MYGLLRYLADLAGQVISGKLLGLGKTVKQQIYVLSTEKPDIYTCINHAIWHKGTVQAATN